MYVFDTGVLSHTCVAGSGVSPVALGKIERGDRDTGPQPRGDEAAGAGVGELSVSHFSIPSQVTEHEPRRGGVEIHPLIESHRTDSWLSVHVGEAGGSAGARLAGSPSGVSAMSSKHRCRRQ